MAVDLKKHPGLNPEYFRQIGARQQAMAEKWSRKRQAVVLGLDPSRIRPNQVPKQPNKYVPHIGAKQRSKSA